MWFKHVIYFYFFPLCLSTVFKKRNAHRNKRPLNFPVVDTSTIDITIASKYDYHPDLESHRLVWSPFMLIEIGMLWRG